MKRSVEAVEVAQSKNDASADTGCRRWARGNATAHALDCDNMKGHHKDCDNMKGRQCGFLSEGMHLMTGTMVNESESM